MAQQTRRMSNSELLPKLMTKAREATGWWDSRLSKERTRVLDYYNAKLPRKQSEGGSSYVSPDVYDSVEMLKSQLLETFAGGDEIAQFDPDQDMAIEECRVATEYARYVIFHENNGYQTFNDVIHDGLTARVGVSKVFWEELFDYDVEEFSNLTQDEVEGLAAQGEVEKLDADLNEELGLYKGVLTRKVDKSKITILPIPPEEFMIEPRAITIPRSGYCGHRTLKSKAELKKMGFDPAIVDRIHYDDQKSMDLTPEVLARNATVETYQMQVQPIQPEVEQVILYESYIKMDLGGGDGVRLYRIHHAGSEILSDPQEVSSYPFFPYVPLPQPHIFFGNNYAARVIQIQNARTVLARSILDHAAMTNAPRWGIVKGGLPNPREMIDNRLGGLVNVARPDSIFPLPQPPLNPYVFELLDKMEQENEKSTGVSALSQGLNKDAISKQNSRGLIGDLVSLSTQRQKVAARNFAYNYFVPIMLEVINLAILHEKKTKIIEVSGNWVPITPNTWTERKSCVVSMHLGYGEKDQALEKITTMYKFIVGDPVLNNCFEPMGRYKLYRDATKMAGLTMAGSYLTPPSQLPNQGAPQPDPLKIAEVRAKATTADAQMLNAQDNKAKNERLSMVDSQKLQQNAAKMHHDAMVSDRDANRHDLEAAHRVMVAEREMRLEERMRPKEVSAKEIINPRP